MRIKASTLLESLVAMALLAAVLSTSGLVFANVLRGDRSSLRTRARCELGLCVIRWSEGNELSSETWTSTGLVVHMTPMGRDPDHALFTVTASDGSTILAEHHFRPAR